MSILYRPQFLTLGLYSIPYKRATFIDPTTDPVREEKGLAGNCYLMGVITIEQKDNDQ